MGFFSKIMEFLDDGDTKKNEERPDMENLKFGTFKGEPIFWKPIELRMGSRGAAYITAKPLFRDKFNDFDSNKYAEVNIWKTSTLRKYLNDEFYNTCFSDYEKKWIYTNEIKSIGNTTIDAYNRKHIANITTQDKVFLLPSSIVKTGNFGCSSPCWTRDAYVEQRKEKYLQYEIVTDVNEARADLVQESDFISLVCIDGGEYRRLPADENAYVFPVIVLNYDFFFETNKSEKRNTFSYEDLYDDDKRKEFVRSVIKEYDENKNKR